MQLLGGSCPKPTVCYSNAPWVYQLNVGPLTKQFRLANTSLQTTRLSPRSFSVHLPPVNWGVGPKANTSTRRGGPDFRAVRIWKLQRPFLSCTGTTDVGLCTFVKSYLRCYPEGFAQRLLTIYEGRKSFPEHLRSKAHVDLTLSDRALFEQMQVGDLWLDGRLPAVWAYLYGSKHVTIPPSWENAMKEFDLAVTQQVPHLYL